MAFDASSYSGILQCALVGCILTFIVQSSQPRLGSTIGLAQIFVIQFETAAALVMGERMLGPRSLPGSHPLVQNTNAKRAAYLHVLNMLGVASITAIFPL